MKHKARAAVAGTAAALLTGAGLALGGGAAEAGAVPGAACKNAFDDSPAAAWCSYTVTEAGTRMVERQDALGGTLRVPVTWCAGEGSCGVTFNIGTSDSTEITTVTASFGTGESTTSDEVSRLRVCIARSGGDFVATVRTSTCESRESSAAAATSMDDPAFVEDAGY